MKIIIIGANGEIGRLVTPHIQAEHEVITAGRSDGDIRVDISDSDSIIEMYEKVGGLDAVVSVAGDAETAVVSELSAENIEAGFRGKLLAQINLVLVGQKYLNDGGSFTLTTGIMGERPLPGNAGKAVLNGGLHSFVLAAALDLERGLRINAVSPGKIGKVPDADVIDAYRRSIETDANGEILRIY